MQNRRRANRFQQNRFASLGLRTQFHDEAPDFKYRHILVATSLSTADHAALLLGFELASLHEATLTLLHVLPGPKSGLDAIDLLHSAAGEFRTASAAPPPSEAARGRLRRFVYEFVPRELLSAVIWWGESRPGGVAETVVSQVNDSGADLVILSEKPSRWWLPHFPFDAWTIRRRARASVIVVRPQVKSVLS